MLRAAAQRSYYSATLAEFCAADGTRSSPEWPGGTIRPHHDSAGCMARGGRGPSACSGAARRCTLPRVHHSAHGPSNRCGRHHRASYLRSRVQGRGRGFLLQDVDQVVDYALDLHNFHEGSHNAYVAPVLICTRASWDRQRVPVTVPPDRLFEVSRTNAEGLAATIERILSLVARAEIRIDQWEESGYKPTPTIIEATLALYRGHSVTEISRSDAGATNLSKTASSVASIIAATKARSQKAICFVTGVPGAGKTLVGSRRRDKAHRVKDELYSVFLSGNGPLVAILQEALARDKVRQEHLRGKAVRKGTALSEVRAFIQNVHHFRDECLVDPEKPPVEHVAIFDEAQRAWNLKQTVDFMRRKKRSRGFQPIRAGVPDLLPGPAQGLGGDYCLVGAGKRSIRVRRGSASGWMPWTGPFRNGGSTYPTDSWTVSMVRVRL